MAQFMFATGIENSYPTITWQGHTIRQDELGKTRHYERWRDDFALLRELGIHYLRYGPPYYTAHLGARSYDWSFADETLRALDAQHVTVIADLCHFGVPDWVGDFENPDWPELFAGYARAFAERYVFSSIRLVERAAGERSRVRHRTEAPVPGERARHACDSRRPSRGALHSERVDAVLS